MSQKKWDSGDIVDQKSRIAIVTGSSSGIGYETARVLAEKNATVIMAVRNLDKGTRPRIRSGPATRMRISQSWNWIWPIWNPYAASQRSLRKIILAWIF